MERARFRRKCCGDEVGEPRIAAAARVRYAGGPRRAAAAGRGKRPPPRRGSPPLRPVAAGNGYAATANHRAAGAALLGMRRSSMVQPPQLNRAAPAGRCLDVSTMPV